MAAYTAGQVSISNGSKAVVINSDENPESVAKGDFLYISGSDPKEINRTYINEAQKHVIELVVKWDSGNKTGQPAIVIPTTVNFRATVDAIQNANLLINDNMQAMSDWQTQEGEVVFTGLDGNSYTFPSLKALQQQVDEAVAEANQATTDTILAAIDVRRAETPLLSVPFNDGVRIEHGYGEHDKLDISAAQDGSLVVDLPTKSAAFSCSGMRWNFNKSGVFEELPPNTPAITDKGIFLHGEYTNYQLKNTNLSLRPTVNLVTSQVSEDSPIGSESTELIESLDSGEHYMDVLNYPCEQGVSYNFSVFVKAGEDAGVRDILLRTHSGLVSTTKFFVANDGTIKTLNESAGLVESYGSGWYRISTKIKAETTANVGFRVQLLNGASTVYMGESGFSVLVTGSQITNTLEIMPPVLTEGASVTVPATTCQLPVAGNFPSLGRSFTLAFDAALPNKRSIVLTIGGVGFVIWRFQEGGKLSFRIEASGQDTNLPMNNDIKASTRETRYAIVWDETASEFRSYANGALQGVQYMEDFDWHTSSMGAPNGIMSIGGGLQSSYLNSSLKGLKILGYAASDSEIESWGAPK